MEQLDSNNQQSIDAEDIIKTPEDMQRIVAFLNKSDYEFYKEIWEESTEEEFEEFCREFPEARMVLDELK